VPVGTSQADGERHALAITDQMTFAASLGSIGGIRTSLRPATKRPHGAEPPKRIVIVTFDSVEAARKWYDSPEYSAIKPIRQRSAKARGFIVEGVAPRGARAGDQSNPQ